MAKGRTIPIGPGSPANIQPKSEPKPSISNISILDLLAGGGGITLGGRGGGGGQPQWTSQMSRDPRSKQGMNLLTERGPLAYGGMWSANAALTEGKAPNYMSPAMAGTVGLPAEVYNQYYNQQGGFVKPKAWEPKPSIDPGWLALPGWGLDRGQVGDAARWTAMAMNEGKLPNRMSPQMAGALDIDEEIRQQYYNDIYRDWGLLTDEEKNSRRYGWRGGYGGGWGGGGGSNIPRWFLDMIYWRI